MVHIKEFAFTSIFALHAAVDPAMAFTATTHACPTRHFGSYTGTTTSSSSRGSMSILNLHPDQALELEAAASELLKVSEENEGNEKEEKLIDDTNNKRSSSPLSASSSSTSQPERKWWSMQFFSVVRRQGHGR